MQVRTFCALFLLGTLLAITACEKIDADDLGLSGSQDTTSDSQTPSGGGSEEDDNTSSGTAKIELDELPDGTLWFPSNDHALLLPEGDGLPAMYVSLYEWHDIVGSDVVKMQEIADHYKEGDLEGWSIPTKEESKAIKNEYYSTNEDGVNTLCEQLSALNSRITSLGGTKLRAWQLKAGYPAYRYLCEDGTYTFSLKSGSNTIKTGAKTKYNLRLVRRGDTAN